MDIENQETKTKLSINPNKTEKNIGPKTTGTLKFVKTFLWCAIIFILIMGVFQLIRSKQPKIIKNSIEYNFAPVENDTAKAFAVTFTKEYLTYDSAKVADYNSRVAPFLVSSIQGGTKVEYSKGISKVLDAMVWKVDKLTSEHGNIVVRANVETSDVLDAVDSTNAYGQKEKKPIVNDEIIYLTVPIGYYNGGFLVEDYPAFTADPVKPADPKLESYSGKSEIDSTKVEIKTVLTNFFKTYSTGDSGQISYYMDNNKSVQGYQGKYIFNSIDSLDAYKDTSTTTVAVVQASMKDSLLGTVFTQRFIFTLRKPTDNQNRWYIIDFTSRGNIYK